MKDSLTLQNNSSLRSYSHTLQHEKNQRSQRKIMIEVLWHSHFLLNKAAEVPGI